MRPAPVLAAAALVGSTLLTFGLVQGCGSDTPSGPVGGPVAGAADTHCKMAQETLEAACQSRPDAAPPGTPDAPETSDYGDPLYNQEGDDDDCKYHYAWTSTAIYRSYDIHFTLTLTKKTDGTPAAGADPYIEATLDDKFSAPPTDQKAKETAPGVYDIGPMQFDMPGMWLVRFHVYHTCLDLVRTSPHGHAAFLIRVP